MQLIPRQRLKELLTSFKTCRIIVVGDIMLDEYLWGVVDRISPEAPVPIVQVKRESWRVGGAANVAANVKSFGAKVCLFGVVGDDLAGRRLLETLNAEGINTSGIIIDSGRPTTLKTRIIGHNQQMLRIDKESTENIDVEIQEGILDLILKALPEVDGVIVSDYAKGVIVEGLIKPLIEKVRKENKFIVVDPKLKNFNLYRKATLITPNTKEAASALGRVFEKEEDVLKAGEDLLHLYKTDAILITRGEHGMSLFQKNADPITIPTHALEVYDVTGAGDTVIATFALALASKASMLEAAQISNLAAGVVVGIVGTAVATVSKVLEHYDRLNIHILENNGNSKVNND